jgi:hypothetical protein
LTLRDSVRKSFLESYLAALSPSRLRWQRPCACVNRTNMKKTQVLTLEAAPGAALAWALLLAEVAAAILLFSFGQVPTVLARSLQLFLRF